MNEHIMDSRRIDWEWMGPMHRWRIGRGGQAENVWRMDKEWMNIGCDYEGQRMDIGQMKVRWRTT